jgi:hypothetical protein
MREGRRWVVPRGTWMVPSLLHPLLSSDDVDRFRKLASRGGCLSWQHIDLSEALGLVLFRVVREGIGITRRLSAQWALSLQALRILTLEPERLKNRSTTP